MPTGYTSGVATGEIATFREFALQCARAFGACVTLRDDPVTSEIPTFEPAEYYYTALQNAKTKLAEWDEADAVTVKTMYDTYCEEESKRVNERLREMRTTRARYEAMLSHVLKFVPPTNDHEALRDFMIQQLTDSIKWDCNCNESHVAEPLPAFSEWQQQYDATLRRKVAYQTDELAKEIERVNSRNAWVSALKAALNEDKG